MASKNAPEREFARRERTHLGLPGPFDEAKAILDKQQGKQFEVILSCVRRGGYLETACKVACISKQRFYEWCKMGNEGLEPYATFIEQLNREQGLATMDGLDVIALAGARGDWKAVAWRLERMYPELYGQRLELTERKDYSPNAPEAAKTANLSRLSLKDAKALKELIAKASGVTEHLIDSEPE